MFVYDIEDSFNKLTIFTPLTLTGYVVLTFPARIYAPEWCPFLKVLVILNTPVLQQRGKNDVNRCEGLRVRFRLRR